MTEQLSVSSQKEVPKHRDALQEKYDKEPKKVEKDLTSEHAKLPEPTGWRILVLPFKMKEKTKGGILITDDVVAAMVSGGVDNMEKYQYMLGQLRTYQYMSQEISSMLDKKEQKNDGTVISIKPQGSPKT